MTRAKKFISAFPPIKSYLHGRTTFRKIVGVAVVLAAVAFTGAPAYADVTEKDIQIMGRVLGFIQNGPEGEVRLGIVYNPDSSASKQTAQSIADMMGSGKKAGKVTFTPVVISSSEVSSSGATVVLVLDGVNITKVVSAVSGKGIVTIGQSRDCLDNKSCVIVVESAPRVEIMVSRFASDATGVSFASAFRAMIKEFE